MDLSPLYDFVMDDDVDNKILVKNVYVAPAIVAVYVLFAKFVGPQMMRNRKPFNLKTTMIVYNFTQTALNAFITYQLITFAVEIWPHHCQPKQNPQMPIWKKRMMRYVWWLNLTKFGDLLDTIFFVLRKKNNQISFLHVFHHGIMCLIVPLVLKLDDIGYYLLVTVSINTAIHVIMYFYYAMAAIGPHMQKYLWWKRYLTTIQIMQFVIDLSFLVVGMLTGCEDTGPIEFIMMTFLSLLLILFLNFYIKSYKTKRE